MSADTRYRSCTSGAPLATMGTAGAALRIWPVRFTDADFGGYRADTLGHEAARMKVRQVASETRAVRWPWAETAVLQALEGHKPRVPGTPAAVELEQLCIAIN